MLTWIAEKHATRASATSTTHSKPSNDHMRSMAGLLTLQRGVGNKAVTEWLTKHTSLQRCGAVTHPGCSCTLEREEATPALSIQRVGTSSEQPASPSVQREIVDEAAGGCGVCEGPARAGEVAHTLIQTEFEITHPLGLVELPFSAPGDDNGRLDLAVATPRGLQIGEIKPGNPDGYLRGESEMLWYLSAVQAAYPGRSVEPLRIPIGPEVGVFPNERSPECPPQMLYVNPPINGVYGYHCSPTYSELKRTGRCRCAGERHRVPVPVPVAEREKRAVTDFIRRLIATGEAAGSAIPVFLESHPEVRSWLLAAGVAIIVATILEDIATLGAGLADDPATLSIALALIRAVATRR